MDDICDLVLLPSCPFPHADTQRAPSPWRGPQQTPSPLRADPPVGTQPIELSGVHLWVWAWISALEKGWELGGGGGVCRRQGRQTSWRRRLDQEQGTQGLLVRPGPSKVPHAAHLRVSPCPGPRPDPLLPPPPHGAVSMAIQGHSCHLGSDSSALVFQQFDRSVQRLLATRIAVYLMTFLIVTVAWAAHTRWELPAGPRLLSGFPYPAPHHARVPRGGGQQVAPPTLMRVGMALLTLAPGPGTVRTVQ